MDEGNPFQPAAGARPPYLVGREVERASIDDAVGRFERGSPPVSMAFVGLRGMGKTALLSELESRLDAKRVVVFRFEVERAQSLESAIRSEIARVRDDFDGVSKRIRNTLDRALEHLPTMTFELPDHLGSVALARKDAAPADDASPLASVITAFNDAVRARERRLALLIDEVQDASVAAFGSIAASVHRSASTDRPILLATAGLPQAITLFRKIRTYTQRWDQLELRLLTRSEVAAALRIPIVRSGATVEDATIERLADECGGYPYFVQLFGSAVWNHHRDDRITMNDVEAIVAPVRARIERAFYEPALDSMTPRELAFALALAAQGPGRQRLALVAAALGTTSDRLGSVRTNLIRKDIVLSPGPRLLEFRIPLFDRYLNEHRAALIGEST